MSTTKTKPLKLSEIPDDMKAVWNKKWLRFKRAEIKKLPKDKPFQTKAMLEQFCKNNNLVAE